MPSPEGLCKSLRKLSSGVRLLDQSVINALCSICLARLSFVMLSCLSGLQPHQQKPAGSHLSHELGWVALPRAKSDLDNGDRAALSWSDLLEDMGGMVFVPSVIAQVGKKYSCSVKQSRIMPVQTCPHIVVDLSQGPMAA